MESAIVKGTLFDEAKLANADFFGADLEPTDLRDSEATAFRVQMALDVDAVVTVMYDDGVTTMEAELKEGNAFTGGCLYTFVIACRKGYAVNFKADQNVNVDLMFVDEVIGPVI